jgi:hypothetical protein
MCKYEHHFFVSDSAALEDAGIEPRTVKRLHWQSDVLITRSSAIFIFKKFQVTLEYIDDSGRSLNSKEAFRYLSHKFHGKTSGKLKTEKRQRKVSYF